MDVEVSAGDPRAVGADLIAAAGARASELGAPEGAVAAADPVAMVYEAGAPFAVVALEPGTDGLRTGAARAVRACRDGGTVAWALDASLPVPVEDQVRALAEGAVIGGYDGRRWRSGGDQIGHDGARIARAYLNIHLLHIIGKLSHSDWRQYDVG